MSSWTGIDPGGTEQLWDPLVLVEALKIFKAYEPSSRVDPQSPIFDALQAVFPDITWREWHADKTFRPIFRKTNPWARLGLISRDTESVYVTPLGDELLSGTRTLSEIFIEATKFHVEPDGTSSFAVMCKAALAAPNHVFTLLDVEYGVSKFAPTANQNLLTTIANLRAQKVVFPKKSRRPRTLRSFMNTLVTAGAMITVTGGWVLGNRSSAAEIANVIPLGTVAPLTTIFDAAEAGPIFREILPGKRTVPIFDVSSTVFTDPANRILLLEKATAIHELLVEICAAEVRDTSHLPIEDANSFDLAVENIPLIVEVKSIHASNAISQLRKAVVQLHEYRWRHRTRFDKETRLAIITNVNPAVFVDEDFMKFLSEDRDVKVFWPVEGILRNASDGLFTTFITAS